MLALLVFSIMPMVLAQDSEAVTLVAEDGTELPAPGIGPGSAWYGFENGWDRMRLAFTFNQEAKIQKALDIAEERLAEAEASEDSAKAELARLRYNNFVEKAEQAMERIQNQKESQTENALVQTQRAQERLALHQERVSDSKTRILARMELRNASEEQIAKISEVFGKIMTRTKTAQEYAAQREENLRTRYKALSGLSDDEIDSAIEARIQTRAEVRSEIRSQIQEEVETEESDDDSSKGSENNSENSGQSDSA